MSKYSPQKYEYPKEVTEDNFKELVLRAKEIKRIASITTGTAILVSFLLFTIVIIFLLPQLSSVRDNSSLLMTALVIAFVLTFVATFFFVDFINANLRRIYNNYISYYPSPEEFVFAQCILAANFVNENKRVNASFRTRFLCPEFSLYTKYDPLNYRRRFYANEFRLIAGGEIQIGRMLLFSEGKVQELLSNFALTLVNHDDPLAYLFLNQLIEEIEKYGKLEDWRKKIENLSTSVKGIVGIIATIITIIGILWGIFH